jgi:hypothetical protein
MPKAIQQLLFLLIAALMAVGSATATACDERTFDSALDSAGLPWYDSKAKELKSTKAPKRSASAVADRHRIPAFKKKKTATKTNKPPTPVATGASTFSTVGTVIMYLVAGVLAIILIGALIYGFLKLESGDGSEEIDVEKRKRKIRDHIKHLPFEIEEQDGDFETFSEKSFRDGDYANAVIYLFADLLVAMSESGLVRLQRGKTNRQYLNEIWEHREIRPYYQEVMTAFEDAFFGKHEIDKQRAEACFAGRAAFDAGLEKIKSTKYSAHQNSPILPTAVSVEGVS